MMTFRAFIAVEVPFSEELEKFSKDIKASGANLKMVDLRNIHVTLKFLGDIEESLVPEVEKAMKDAVAGIPPFKARLLGTGAFPNIGRPTVIWAGLEHAEPLEVMARRLEEGLVPLGFEPEKRKFSPHVTVARVKDGRNKLELTEALSFWEEGDFGQVPVDQLILKKSVLRPEGPEYSDVTVVSLG
jgi:2'-5' RNA ligase